MTDEELLKALANEARALDPAGDPRLPRLVDGSLPEPERAALTEQAATSPSARDALAAFDPLPDASRRRLFETASAALSTASPADTASPPRADTASPPRKDTPARIAPRRSRAFVPVFAGLSMAAALAFFLTREAPQPLPPFALEASGAAGVRSPPKSAPGVTVLGPDARLTLVLRPSTAVTGPLEVRAFLAQGDRAAPFHPPVTVSPEGLVRIAGPRDTLFPGVSSGTARILLAVGRPGDLPPDSETTVTSLRDAAANARGAWILAEHELRWVDTAEPPP